MNSLIIANRSAWDLATIEQYLENKCVPCRLSCITSDGFPHVTSLWFSYSDSRLWFSVQKSLCISAWLVAEPRCGFEIAGDDPPYLGVRGRGYAEVMPASTKPVLKSLIKRYMGTLDSSLARWLLSRPDTELTLALDPCWITSWDYAKRMNKGS